uniref:Putative secreted peptide n=1 Tax=Anopheles braziliensis TaxID=58242 RepID=A0A2M3ZUV8_9DIPT
MSSMATHRHTLWMPCCLLMHGHSDWVSLTSDDRHQVTTVHCRPRRRALQRHHHHHRYCCCPRKHSKAHSRPPRPHLQPNPTFLALE